MKRSLTLLRRKYFHPQHHLWFEVVVDQNKILTLGLTRVRIQNMGDVTSIVPLHHKTNKNVLRHEPILSLQWEGFVQTSADELYHTVWDSIEGEEIIQSPIDGQLIKYASAEEQVDEETELAQLQCDEDDISQLLATCVTEKDYNRLTTGKQGRFAPT